MSTVLDRTLEQISSKICINPSDRARYTKDFDVIRDNVLGEMKKDQVFNYIFGGPSLFGSYIDNLKIGQADEFDLHFKIKMPNHELIKVEKDHMRPGYVRLNFENVLSKLKNDFNNQKSLQIYEKFKNFVEGNYLERNNLNDWFEELIENGLKGKGCSINGYKIDYKRKGTAHTIEGVKGGKKISIDLVPAFVFEKADWIASKPFPNNVKTKLWFAVPKPAGRVADKLKSTDQYTFSICAPQIERDLLLNKNNLKECVRLLKALRDKYEMGLLKSHFIKTVFLLENEKVSKDFWERSISDIFVDMLGKLVTYLKDGVLPSYWDTNDNLFRGLGESKTEYKDILDKIHKQFLSYKQGVQFHPESIEKHFILKSTQELSYWH